MTARLDPDALEAAAKAHIANTVRATYSVTGLPAAITAYIASIEPRLRRAVVELIKAAGDVCDAAEGFAFDPTDEQAVQINEAQDNLDQTEAALLALLGLEPNE